MNITNFHLNQEKCIGCGLCIKVCPGGILSFGKDRKVTIQEVKEFGWDGCWKCQHCLAVCPKGAISIHEKKPENSLLPPKLGQTATMLDAMIANRRACRRYRDENVNSQVIDEMFHSLQNAPTGGNKQLVEYTLVDDKEQMDKFRKLVYRKMEEQAKQGIYPDTFDEKSYEQMKSWEANVRPDMLFCSAPHILIPHAPIGKGCWTQDVDVACAYFELLCASRGLGASMMTYPLSVLNNMPDVKKLLEIPENHYIGMIVGFGYPEIPYARGVQRGENGKIHRITF